MSSTDLNVPIFNQTPLIREFLSKDSNAPQTLLKYEVLQPSRSFKSRGIGHLILTRAKEIRAMGNKDVHVFSSSGGNAGYAAAVASSRLGLRCTVVVPVTTKEHMIQKIREIGSEVIIKGAHWNEADTYLREGIIEKLDKSTVEPIYVHPFDDPLVWEGHSTMVDEIVESLKGDDINLERVKGIICSVGGGGLYNGIMTGLCRHNLAEQIPVIAVETIGADTMYQSLKMDKPVVLDGITSVATSLGSVYITETTFNFAKKYGSKSIALPDKEVMKTSLEFTNLSNFITEPACAASIHLGYHPEIIENALGSKLTADDIVIIIACGGSTWTYQNLEDGAKKFNL